jgi:hypothetical protein
VQVADKSAGSAEQGIDLALPGALASAGVESVC